MKYRSTLRFVLEGFEGVGVLLLALCTWPLTARWLRNWGASAEEHDRTWPGDELVSPAHETYTRAVSIAAPTACVWQWVVQFGLGRAGFYSYELLERLVGVPVKNVESIVPEYQSLSIGGEVRLHPEAPGIPIALLDPGRHVCFGELNRGGQTDDVPDPLRSWSFYMEPVAADSCRLILRACIDPLRDPSWQKRLALALEGPIDWVMEQRMLRTIRRLAEAPGP